MTGNEKHICPLLKNPENYNPDTLDLVDNLHARGYWLSCLEQMVKKFVNKAQYLNPKDPKATEKAEICYQEFHNLVEQLAIDPSHLKPLSIRTLLEFNEDNLRSKNFKDAWQQQKESESVDALSKLKSRIEYIDAIINFEEKWQEIIQGVLAGNVFDWGAKVIRDILENSKSFGFEDAVKTIQRRPWFVDKFEDFVNKLKITPYRTCVLFVDNSGVDFILGILPLARELLSQGTKVILTANSYPALNDVTFQELNIYCQKAAEYCTIFNDSLNNKQLITVENGQKGPCLNLADLSAELCKCMELADLVIIEGMARAVHTNLYTKLTVDCLKLAVLKNEWLAQNMGAEQFSVICDFDSVAVGTAVAVHPKDGHSVISTTFAVPIIAEIKMLKKYHRKPAFHIPVEEGIDEIMEEIKQNQIQKKAHPLKRVNKFSQLFFCWFPGFLSKGFKRDLDENDMYATRNSQKSDYLGERLEAAWNKELLKKKPSLLRALFTVFKLELLCYAFFSAFTDFIRIAQPMLISRLISYYQPGSTIINKTEIYVNALLIVMVALIQVTSIHNYQLRVMALGMKIRISACALIYRKALKLSKTALIDTTIGQMVNLLSNDVGRFDFSAQHIHTMWLAPCETIIVMILLYFYVGITGLIGCAFLLSFVPFQMYMAKLTSQYRLKTAVRTDERVRLMNEIINGIQVIKMYTWEKPFAKLVEFVRRKEINEIKHTSTIRGILMSFNLTMSRTAIFLCVLVYVLTGNSLTASYAFTISSFYAFLRITVTQHFPLAITQFAETTVSVSRIQTFLLYDEIDNNINTVVNKVNGVTTELTHKKNVGIKLKNVCAKWIKSTTDNTLENITFEAKSNQLIAIVGPVGGGKSTLLHVILKELLASAGTVHVEGTISYASQEPWIFGGSIRQNIIFGQKYDEQRYAEVIRVCALERDLTLFPHSDRTLVGERGVMLSGGQRARINLARAVYRDSDIYLLDDPLSAVDAHVGKQLYTKCLREYLKNKCVILITHQLQYLRTADCIYLFEDGKIKTSGTYQTLKNSDSAFTKFLQSSKEEEKKDVARRLSKAESVESEGEVVEVEIIEQKREERATGQVAKRVYLNYLKAGGHWIKTVALFCAFVSAQVLGNLTDIFLTTWVNLEQWRVEKNISSQNGTDYESEMFWDKILNENNTLVIYSCLVVSTIILAVTRSVSFFRFCLTASTGFHNLMFAKIVRSPMQFFNSNPSGRILNRFSKDIGALDETLPVCLVDTVGIGLIVTGTALVIASVNPWILVPTVVIVIIFYFIRYVFLASSRDIKRVEAITRSPIYTHLSASLNGLTTIRAFRAEKLLTKEFDNFQDGYTSAYYMFLSANRGFGFWLDIHCVIFIALVLISILFIQKESYGGNVGLSLTQTVTLTGMFQWGMRQWSELENQMTSVERVQEYGDLPTEIDDCKKKTPIDWPNSGKIKFENMSLRYSLDGSYVLNNLNFEVKSGEKVGIVGRTGAGKSSLIQALFRLAYIEGNIFIDSINTRNVELKCLRSQISIIPQEPVLFSGTLRKNLDPFDEYEDAVLWEALEEVELKHVVDELPAGLDSKMSEGGSNFSVGQRQLVCLARAVVRNNKILVLDEATANVDPMTDSVLQNTIRQKFSNCTVLTIAHRLHTIMDSDKVLVMDAGEVAEFDHPHTLLKNKGVFYTLVKQTGSTMANNLQAVAEESFHSRNTQNEII